MVTNGRVRIGYRIGETLYERADPNGFRGVLHIIGERPGTMHHAYSVYITAARGKVWAEKKIDHDITKLVSNVADTALPPEQAARETRQRPTTTNLTANASSRGFAKAKAAAGMGEPAYLRLH
jgi:ethanolamine ammonia-lyase large subunit